MPDPDLLIRTGGESALATICFGNVLIPNYIFVKRSGRTSAKRICKAIYDYQKRERRFGKTSEQYKVR